MPDYRLFGAVFRSELEFPELGPVSAQRAHWSLTRSDALRDDLLLTFLGTEDVEPGVSVSLYRSSDRYRLRFDDTGTFDITPSSHRIQWTPGGAINLDAVRKDVLGRVFSVCLQLDGAAVLHGSAVHVGGRALAFLAPKFHGKSTTAAALVDRGARLLADDLVAVMGTKPPRIAPGIPVVQLWKDSAARVAQHSASDRGDGDSPKLQRGWDDAARVAAAAIPFGAAYLLAPFVNDVGRPVRRQRLPQIPAALALLGQAKIGTLIGPEWRAQMLSRLVAIAETVPVYRLEVPRDYSRLDELTDALWSWHSAVAPSQRAPT